MTVAYHLMPNMQPNGLLAHSKSSPYPSSEAHTDCERCQGLRRSCTWAASSQLSCDSCMRLGTSCKSTIGHSGSDFIQLPPIRSNIVNDKNDLPPILSSPDIKLSPGSKRRLQERSSLPDDSSSKASSNKKARLEDTYLARSPSVKHEQPSPSLMRASPCSVDSDTTLIHPHPYRGHAGASPLSRSGHSDLTTSPALPHREYTERERSYSLSRKSDHHQTDLEKVVASQAEEIKRLHLTIEALNRNSKDISKALEQRDKVIESQHVEMERRRLTIGELEKRISGFRASEQRLRKKQETIGDRTFNEALDVLIDKLPF